jgi:hypothetical protein
LFLRWLNGMNTGVEQVQHDRIMLVDAHLIGFLNRASQVRILPGARARLACVSRTGPLRRRSLTQRACVSGGRPVAPFHMYWRHSGARPKLVPSIQVKDVPADVHATLRRRAAAVGKSLQEYLLEELTEQARMPTLDELLDRAGARAGGRAEFVAAAQAVRAERDTR